MANLNTGTRSTAEDKAALDELIATAKSEGKKVVSDETGTFIIDEAFGLKIRQRIA